MRWATGVIIEEAIAGSLEAKRCRAPRSLVPSRAALLFSEEILMVIGGGGQERNKHARFRSFPVAFGRRRITKLLQHIYARTAHRAPAKVSIFD